MASPQENTFPFRPASHASLPLSLCLLFASVLTAPAAIVKMEISERLDLDKTGYEQISGRLHFQIDPTHKRNTVIADVDLAPLDADRKVNFTADFRLLKPKDFSKSNGAAWVEIPNRGSKAKLPPALMAQGFTLLSVGWEFDVPAGPDKLRLEVPAARNKDGSPIRGVVKATFTPDKHLEEHTINELGAYPAVDIEGADSKLIVRTRAEFPSGKELPRERWSLKGNRIRLEGGLTPGCTYEISYLAEGPPVAGLGYAAIRDAAAWLKHSGDSPAPVKNAYAFGSSQCGRFLRDFLYLGFNSDEQERQALDGFIAHVAGAGRLVLNQRWSTPLSEAGYYTASYPFADTAQMDPRSGHIEGVLENSRVQNTPKIFYTNTASEYWGAGRVAALTHTDPTGTRDISFPENVRSYFFAATSHGAAPFPPASQVKGSPLANPVNTGASVEALREAMHRWVTQSIAPPPSVFPKLSEGTLTGPAEVRFPKIPGLASPNAVQAGIRVRNPQWADGAGEGAELPLLVPQVDADGNDLGGIRMPDIAVPLGTATGWVFRPPAFGAAQNFYLLRGAWIPFAKTRDQREANNDPRPSIQERYSSKDEYLAKVKEALQKLMNEKLMLSKDLAPQLKQAGERWDWVVNSTTP
jgi:Alpha/beta hydrolase domain